LAGLSLATNLLRAYATDRLVIWKCLALFDSRTHATLRGRIKPVQDGTFMFCVTAPGPYGSLEAHAVAWTKEDCCMNRLDWSQCEAVESVPGKVSGAWVFKETRTPVAVVFENLEDGMTIDEVMEQFAVTRPQARAVLEFAARSLDVVVTA